MPAEPPAPFIVGTGRCGTTLLRMMLDAHPDLAIPPETHWVSAVAVTCRESPDPRETFLAAVLGHPRWPDFHLDAEALRRRIEAIEPFDVGEAVRAFHRLYAAGFGKDRWGNKTPLYLLHMRLIGEVLPEAHFVHVIRDGRDVALSVRDLWFGPSSIAEAARWWVSRLEEGRRQAAGLTHYLEVRYEDLVARPERTLRQVCAFIHLPWTPALLDYGPHVEGRLRELDHNVMSPDGSRTVAAAERRAIFGRTARPPDPSRAGRWRVEMSAAERATFEAIAGRMLEALGYPTG